MYSWWSAEVYELVESSKPVKELRNRLLYEQSLMAMVVFAVAGHSELRTMFPVPDFLKSVFN